MYDLADPRLLRWSELDPRRPGDEELVLVRGKPLFRYEPEKARRLIERCRELGGSHFRMSEDLAYMHTPWEPGVFNIGDFGFSCTADPDLPDNTVLLADGD